MLNCLEEPQEICELKQDDDQENVWSTKYKFMSTARSDNIYRKEGVKTKYITTYKDIFNRIDVPDENFCFNGSIKSTYLENTDPCESIKYFLNDELSCKNSIFTNEYKFTDIIGRIIEMNQKDKVGILCIEYAPDLFSEY
jgi:hypothetical protein